MFYLIFSVSRRRHFLLLQEEILAADL